ncbi:TrmH family RNA methyltransferase [Candidatus Saccharibacteria bacterium]|nr:TrmH family RNA methyltransferase [Candidatus Saccharibacteria bacterium]MCB9834436.1 TrmH family RNA methyltransferase [Candidatus Nomurabacteria bacterium]
MNILVILDNIRSCHNVGAILRTADGAGITRVICTGFTPYPEIVDDTRDPRIITKNSHRISKTALGAEKTIDIRYDEDINTTIDHLKSVGYTLISLEETPEAVDLYSSLSELKSYPKIALIVGNEVTGVQQSVLNRSDQIICLPQMGDKNSLNVSVATGIALYSLRF